MHSVHSVYSFQFLRRRLVGKQLHHHIPQLVKLRRHHILKSIHLLSEIINLLIIISLHTYNSSFLYYTISLFAIPELRNFVIS